MKTIPAAHADDPTLAPLEAAAQQMPVGDARTAIEGLAATLRSGGDVIVADTNQQLTTTQAAHILGVSRAHLYKVLDSGALPFTVVGARDRRITVADLTTYKSKVDALRKHAARDAAHAHETELLALDEM